MVSFSIILLIAVVIFFAMAFLYVLFIKPKGRTLLIEFYELYGGEKPVLVNPNKRDKGIIINHEGKMKFKIPLKYSKIPLSPPPANCIIRTKGKFDLVRLLKVSEGIYVPMQHTLANLDSDYVQYINEQTEPYNWADNEKNILAQRTTTADKWAKYAPLVVIGIVVLAGLLTIYMTADNINKLMDDYRGEVLGEITEQRSWALDIVNNIKGDSQSNSMVQTDTPNVPPSRTG